MNEDDTYNTQKKSSNKMLFWCLFIFTFIMITVTFAIIYLENQNKNNNQIQQHTYNQAEKLDLTVKVTDIDEQGRINLTMKDLAD